MLVRQSFFSFIQGEIQLAANEEDENLRLLLKYRITGDVKYRNQIVSRNHLLLLKEAGRHCKNEDDFHDFLGEAVLGFISGIEKYDIHKSYKNGRRASLTTYCIYRIRKAVYAHIETHGRAVRLPWRPVVESRKIKVSNKEEFEVPVDKLLEHKSRVLRGGVLDALYGGVDSIHSAGDSGVQFSRIDMHDYRNWQSGQTEGGCDIQEMIKRCTNITSEERERVFGHFGIEGYRKQRLKQKELNLILNKIKVWLSRR